MSKKKGPPYGDTHSERRRQNREEKKKKPRQGLQLKDVEDAFEEYLDSLEERDD